MHKINFQSVNRYGPETLIAICCLALFCLALSGEPKKRAETEIFVGPGRELRVTVPNVSKKSLANVIVSFLAEDKAAKTNLDTVLETATEITFILTTKTPK